MRSPVVTALVGMVALAIPMGVGRFAFTPILPMMQADAGLSITAGGWLAFANYAGTLGGALAAMTVRAPLPAAIRGGLVAIGVATVAMGLEGRFAVWIALRALAGAATGWALPLASAWALERLALRPPALRATVFAGYGVGIAVAGGVCLALMQVATRSRTAWLILGGLSLVLTAVVWRYFADDGGRSPVARAELAAPARWDGESARLVICYGAFGFGYIIPATFLPAMAKEIVPDPRLFGWAWPVFGAAAAVSAVYAARLSERLSHRAIWIGGHLVMALGVVVPLVVPGLQGIIAAALLVGGTFMVVTMAGMQEARKAAGAHARELMAAMTSAFALGQILGPVSVSLLIQSTGSFAPALILAAAVLVVSAISMQRKEGKA